MTTNITSLIRKNILNLAPYSSAREEYTGKEGIFLDANENPFGFYNRYPDPYQSALKHRLSELKGIAPNQIFIGNGSDEVIDIAFRIFCEPNQDKVLTFTPTYGMYEVSANINAVELIKLPLDKSFQINTATLTPYFTDPNLKLIFICSPNNPTGNLLKTEDIEFILTNFKGIVIVDEAYIDFCKAPSFIEKIESYPNLIVSQTLSKAWGLASIRLGIAYMSEAILSYYNKVKAPYNVSVLNQQAALDTLNKQQEFEQNLEAILKEKQALITALQSLKMVHKIYPSDANFLLIEVDNANALYQYLVDKQIIIRNRNSVVENCVRISVGKREENRKLVECLREMV